MTHDLRAFIEDIVSQLPPGWLAGDVRKSFVTHVASQILIRHADKLDARTAIDQARNLAHGLEVRVYNPQDPTK